MALADIGDFLRNAPLSVTSSTTDSADARASALLRRVNTVMMVFDDRLYDLRNGQWVTMTSPGDARPDSENQHTISGQDKQGINTLRLAASNIADAAARLLQPQAGNNQDQPAHKLLICLAPAEFLAVPVNFPGLAPSAVKAALQLQSSTWLPAFDDTLSIAVQSHKRTGTEQEMAFCLPTSRLDKLFTAFHERGLFLAAVIPRSLLLADSSHESGATVSQIDDQDSTTVSRTVLTDQTLTGFLHTAKIDLEDEALAQHWHTELKSMQSVRPTAGAALQIRSAQDYLDRLDLGSIPMLVNEHLKKSIPGYAFFPARALAAGHQFRRGQRMWMAAAVVAGLLVFGSLPFLVQSMQLRGLQARVQEQQLLSAPARENQAAVRDFESQWGVISEFPRQDVPAVLLTLQTVLNPNVLISLEIDKGYVSIEGDSEDPQNLLQQLEQNPLFTEVDFARATNNARYYIDLRLTSVNFPAWQQWYFPERR
jgi:hypothetical protein